MYNLKKVEMESRFSIILNYFTDSVLVQNQLNFSELSMCQNVICIIRDDCY